MSGIVNISSEEQLTELLLSTIRDEGKKVKEPLTYFKLHIYPRTGVIRILITLHESFFVQAANRYAANPMRKFISPSIEITYEAFDKFKAKWRVCEDVDDTDSSDNFIAYYIESFEYLARKTKATV